jgi:hypothetical protein
MPALSSLRDHLASLPNGSKVSDEASEPREAMKDRQVSCHDAMITWLHFPMVPGYQMKDETSKQVTG